MKKPKKSFSSLFSFSKGKKSKAGPGMVSESDSESARGDEPPSATRDTKSNSLRLNKKQYSQDIFFEQNGASGAHLLAPKKYESDTNFDTFDP